MSATCSQAKERHHSAQPSISTPVRGPGMMHVTCHMSRVTCHMSHVTCHVSLVTCHVSPVRYPAVCMTTGRESRPMFARHWTRISAWHGHCLTAALQHRGWPPAVSPCRGRSSPPSPPSWPTAAAGTGTWQHTLYCTVLYCTVLYCTVLTLYCTDTLETGTRCQQTDLGSSRAR